MTTTIIITATGILLTAGVITILFARRGNPLHRLKVALLGLIVAAFASSAAAGPHSGKKKCYAPMHPNYKKKRHNGMQRADKAGANDTRDHIGGDSPENKRMKHYPIKCYKPKFKD